MDSAANKFLTRKLAAFVLPMAAFLVLLLLGGALHKTGGAFWLDSPIYWIYPPQAIICGALLLWFWREYEFRPPKRIVFSVALAVLTFALWVAPQEFLGFPPRLVGFDPEIFSGQPVAFWATIVLRFLRLVVVVPLVEEIFWRGFLLRYFVHEKFHAVPFGTFSWLSFCAATVGFGFAHTQADWIVAFLAGALFNCVAYRTKSLASCVLTHAVTNLLLGLWIMKTGQWGFW